MQERIKEILSPFLKVPSGHINATTVIDRSALSSSILLHRMYAKLAAEQIVVQDYQNVRTFNDLLQQLNTKSDNDGMQDYVSSNGRLPEIMPAAFTDQTDNNRGIGIDIEMVSEMPLASDFREDPFYTMNFTATEIAHCILQVNPYASFAGLFAAKEAIVKADNSFKAIGFKNIVIRHSPGGKPFHTSFNLSVSHKNDIAVAVVFPKNLDLLSTAATREKLPAPIQKGTSAGMWILLLLPLLLSLLTLFLVVRK